MPVSLRSLSLIALLAPSAPLAACAPSSAPSLERPPAGDATRPDPGASPPVLASSPPGTADAAAPAASNAPATAPATAPDAGARPTKVKVVTIGMHVAGGPFDEPTKEPFKKAVEPHFPEIAQCWAAHVPHPPKQADVGVDLLIEAGGGAPKVSNPRSTLPGGGPAVAAETASFVPCVVAVFESVQFPKLDRGRTGVSYSLRLRE